jgi:amidase
MGRRDRALCTGRNHGGGSAAAEISAQLANRTISSEGRTAAYLERIAAMDRKGPQLRAILAVNPDAIAQARASDARRKAARHWGRLMVCPS